VIITPLLLSGSTSGRPIKVAATVLGSATLIHTAVAGATSFDEITLFVTNTDTNIRTVTIGFGGVTDPDDLVCKAVSLPPSSGPIPVVVGLRLNGGLLVKVIADAANLVLVSGFVNRLG
jgi:hypothetical protein